MLLNWKIGGIMAGVFLISLLGVYFYGYTKGSSNCKLTHAVAQVEVEKKARKSYENIIKTAPINAPKRDAIKWLSERTTR